MDIETHKMGRYLLGKFIYKYMIFLFNFGIQMQGIATICRTFLILDLKSYCT